MKVRFSCDHFVWVFRGLLFPDLEQVDDEFSVDTSSRAPNVVVFSDSSLKSTSSTLPTKAQMKAFMVQNNRRTAFSLLLIL